MAHSNFSFIFSCSGKNGRASPKTAFDIFAKDLADDSTLWVLPNVSTEAVLSNMRSLGNLIDIFGKCSKQFGIKEEAGFVLSEYKEYSEIIGLHINDRNTLDKLSNELRRPLALISQKVFETELKLYK